MRIKDQFEKNQQELA